MQKLSLDRLASRYSVTQLAITEQNIETAQSDISLTTRRSPGCSCGDVRVELKGGQFLVGRVIKLLAASKSAQAIRGGPECRPDNSILDPEKM